MCDAINYHILALSQGSIKITNMTLIFKIDENDTLWLLFCTSISIRNIVGATHAEEEAVRRRAAGRVRGETQERYA